MLVFNIPTYGVNSGIVFRLSDSICISRMYNTRESLIREGRTVRYVWNSRSRKGELH